MAPRPSVLTAARIEPEYSGVPYQHRKQCLTRRCWAYGGTIGTHQAPHRHESGAEDSRRRSAALRLAAIDGWRCRLGCPCCMMAISAGLPHEVQYCTSQRITPSPVLTSKVRSSITTLILLIIPYHTIAAAWTSPYTTLASLASTFASLHAPRDSKDFQI